VTYLAVVASIFLTGAGLPLPEDVALLGAGALVLRGWARLGPLVAVALPAVVAGDLFLYAVGARLGRRLVASRRLGVSPERLAAAERWIARHGAWVVAAARLVVGVRAAAFLAAGALRMPLRRFLAADVAAAAVQVPLLVWLGAAGAAELERVAAARLWLLGALAAAAAIVALRAIATARRPSARP